MFFTYLRRELRRRMRQAILISLGLALGIGLVITVTALSAGVKNAQGTVLHALYGVGTDITVSQAPAAGSAGGVGVGVRGGGGAGARGRLGGRVRVRVQRVSRYADAARARNDDPYQHPSRVLPGAAGFLGSDLDRQDAERGRGGGRPD